MPESWRGQILHGVLGPRENVVPEQLPLGQSIIELSHQELRCVRREGGDKARKGFVGARVVLGHDGLAGGARGDAEVADHGGDQGRPSPPQVTPVVACHQEWYGRSPLSEALMEARIWPSKAADLDRTGPR